MIAWEKSGWSIQKKILGYSKSGVINETLYIYSFFSDLSVKCIMMFWEM